jgi:hypothetical protein
MSSIDTERESFSIFSQLSKAKQKTRVDEIADQIMALSILEISQLTSALNDPDVLKACGPGSTNSFPEQSRISLGKNRSPFPHPKHVFAGIDTDQRPGMHTFPQK